MATHECDQSEVQKASHLAVNGSADSRIRAEERNGNGGVPAPPIDQAFKSSVLRDINELKNTVQDIYSKVHLL